MSEVTNMTKAELVEEIRRLRKQYEECSESGEANGKFDEDALFALAEGVDGDEIYLVTETGRFVFVNDTALRNLGYEEHEMLGMSLPRIDPNNTRATWLGRVSRLKQSAEHDVFETEHIAKDGSTQAKEMTAVYVTYKSRSYILCIGKEIDRMEGKRSPASLVRTREQVLLQSTSDGVLVVDTRGTITESNAVADRLLGVSKSETIGRSCVDSRWRLVDNDGSPLSISNHPLMIVLVEEQPLSNRRINMLAPDGSRRMLMINAAPVYDESGSLAGAIGCIRTYEDSVERKEQMRRDTSLNIMHKEVVHAVANAGSVDELERSVCDTLVRHGDYPLVWRGISKTTDERIHPTVSAGTATDYLMKIKVRYDNSEYGNGPIGRAFKTQQIVAVADLAADPTYTPWLHQAERMGLHSLAAFPLQFSGEELGILICYSKEKNNFVGAEFERLKEITQLLSFGIGVRRRIEAEKQLRTEFTAQQMMLDIYNNTLPVAVARFAIREPFRCESANAQFSTLIDEPYRTAGVEGSYVTDFMYAAYHRDLYQRLAEAASGRESVGCEDEVFTDWQGNEMHWSWRIVPVTSETDEQLLYIAFRRDSRAPAMEQAGTSQESGGNEMPAAAANGSEPAVLRLSVPRFGPRAKAVTRVARFLEEGMVVHANSAARTLFSIEGGGADRAPSTVFSPEMAELLSGILMLKGNGETVRFHPPGSRREVACQVFAVQEEESQQLLLVCE